MNHAFLPRSAALMWLSRDDRDIGASVSPGRAARSRRRRHHRLRTSPTRAAPGQVEWRSRLLAVEARRTVVLARSPASPTRAAPGHAAGDNALASTEARFRLREGHARADARLRSRCAARAHLPAWTHRMAQRTADILTPRRPSGWPRPDVHNIRPTGLCRRARARARIAAQPHGALRVSKRFITPAISVGHRWSRSRARPADGPARARLRTLRSSSL